MLSTSAVLSLYQDCHIPLSWLSLSPREISPHSSGAQRRLAAPHTILISGKPGGSILGLPCFNTIYNHLCPTTALSLWTMWHCLSPAGMQGRDLFSSQVPTLIWDSSISSFKISLRGVESCQSPKASSVTITRLSFCFSSNSSSLQPSVQRNFKNLFSATRGRKLVLQVFVLRDQDQCQPSLWTMVAQGQKGEGLRWE